MGFQAPEHDPEEAVRVRRAVVAGASIRQRALRKVVRPGSFEHSMAWRDATLLDDADLMLLARLCWHYRRRLPADVRANLTPDDPIVRENAHA